MRRTLPFPGGGLFVGATLGQDLDGEPGNPPRLPVGRCNDDCPWEQTESAESAAITHDDHRQVVAALRQLPRRQREAFILRYWMELTVAEVAHAMGISVGAAKSHIFWGLGNVSTVMVGSREVRR